MVQRNEIEKAAEAIRSGHLVGMPTETVYGIAADAFNVEAVRKTFDLKGRPADNPLIVHISEAAQLRQVASRVEPGIGALVDAFWPGPLTLVLPKCVGVPSEVTAGLDTVAVRMPRHPVALDLIRLAGTPLSAPSANKFMALSPTRAEDVSPEIASGLFCILDGGPCKVGLESTVLDCTERPFRILRPGAVDADQIRAVAGEVEFGGARRSPGMYPRHYAPRTPLRLAEHLEPQDAGIVFDTAAGPNQIQLPNDPASFAAVLYATLHRLDEHEYPEIVIQMPPRGEGWEAVWDRLLKAATL